MFSLRCYKIVAAGPWKQQIRNKTLFHRSCRVIFKDENLLWTNSLSSGFCMIIGDLIQQEIEYRSNTLKERYDWIRAVRMFLVGTAMGPLHHYYYTYLDKLMPGSNVKTVFKKVVCDQCFASPATIICFYYGMGLLEGKTATESTTELKEKFKYVYLGDCLFWPPVQIINFYYLPSSYRVVYINFATMIFNVFMSYMKHDF